MSGSTVCCLLLLWALTLLVLLRFMRSSTRLRPTPALPPRPTPTLPTPADLRLYRGGELSLIKHASHGRLHPGPRAKCLLGCAA